MPIVDRTLALSGFQDPDDTDRPVVALRMHVLDHAAEIPVHQHRKGQLVLALHGAVTCQVEGAFWIVPPQCGVWIPGDMPHSNRATPNAKLCYLFAEPGIVALPTHCCTLSISLMVREMILRLATAPPDYERDGHTDRLARVLLDELALMPVERLYLPTTEHPKIRQIADALHANPGDRRTISQWAKRLAMSDRSLSRLVVKETGLTFGRWRQQLHLLVAVRELANGASVQRVSDNLGYESVTAFITMFKKALGHPPGRYFATLTRSESESVQMSKTRVCASGP
ncbi:putative transcriptional regulator YeaM, AraC family (plasmid) [Cupriavidus necator H850]|uniref:AraC family transcriptional regulator n=1 Tax=Cupriavidus necator TaxID=106590 RepID=UPI00129EE7D7|nr:helix-turn-helix transcriptional regulator [Cupriavidus necator]KAI3605359.1 putative transcriptional regulator YeaM, AraC family [Cupriavidus necator H850]